MNHRLRLTIISIQIYHIPVCDFHHFEIVCHRKKTQNHVSKNVRVILKLEGIKATFSELTAVLTYTNRFITTKIVAFKFIKGAAADISDKAPIGNYHIIIYSVQ